MENKPAIKLNEGEFLVKFSPINCMMLYKNVSSAILAFQTNSISLVSIKKDYSQDFTLAYLEAWILNLNDFLSIARKMNNAQIQETAILIFDEFYYYNVADINLIFTRIKKGYYGKFYESIDGMKLIDIFYQYSNERANQVARFHESKDLNVNYEGLEFDRINRNINKNDFK